MSSTTPITSSVKTSLVSAGRRAISSSKAADGQPSSTLCAQLLGKDVRDQILLRGEVGVEGAVGQAGVGHHGGQARAVDAVPLEAPPGGFEDPLARRLLVVLAVAHGSFLYDRC
jgi:hypothetical protein